MRHWCRGIVVRGSVRWMVKSEVPLCDGNREDWIARLFVRWMVKSEVPLWDKNREDWVAVHVGMEGRALGHCDAR